MKRLATYSVLVMLLACAHWTASAQSELEKHRSELESLREELRLLEEKIATQQNSEKASLELLDSYDRKATVVRRLIRRYKNTEKELEESISQTRKTIADLGGQYDFLKSQYARYVTSAYKSGRMHDLELLFSSNSVNQLYIRNEYLKRFTAQRKRQAQQLVGTKQEIEETQVRMEQQLSEHRRLIAEKAAEEDRLVSLAADRRTVLARIRADKSTLQRSVDRKMKAARELEQMIARLIEAEQARKERETEHQRLPQAPPTTGGFASKRGKLRWPVSEGTVVARFGNQQHPTLKTITQNTGIDIAVKPGTPVNAVADGEVAKIWWLPSYGNLLIINHYNGYRTVYTHLAEIRVIEGQKLKEGEVIGESGEAMEGPRIHFEIWKDRDKQNPEQWLGK